MRSMVRGLLPVALLFASACSAGQLPPASPVAATGTAARTVTPAGSSPAQPASPAPSATLWSYLPPPTWTTGPPPPPTRTPRPTRSPTPSRTPTPFPPTYTPRPGATPGQILPPITHDLLFAQGGALLRWSRASGRIETLAGDLAMLAQREHGWPEYARAAFALSTDGRFAAFARATAAGTIELVRLELETGRTTPLVTVRAPAVLELALSPDGRWLAYIPQGSEPAVPGATASAPLAPGTPPPWSGVIYVVPVDVPGMPLEVGYCAHEQWDEYNLECSGFLWSPDSRALLWSDARGVWLADLGSAGRLVVPNLTAMPNREGHGYHYLVAWSPAGRHVLGVVGYYEGSQEELLDLRTGAVEMITDTFRIWEPTIWLRDGRLLVLRGPWSLAPGPRPSTGEIWRVDPAREPQLVRDVVFPLSERVDDRPIAPVQLADGRLAFALINGLPGPDGVRGLYMVDPARPAPRKIADLPGFDPNDFWPRIAWAPDGSGALYYAYDSRVHPPHDPPIFPPLQVWYVPTGGAPVDLQAAVGEGACCFAWVP